MSTDTKIDVQCSICLSVLYRPIWLRGCGHRFCQLCWHVWKAETSPIPMVSSLTFTSKHVLDTSKAVFPTPHRSLGPSSMTCTSCPLCRRPTDANETEIYDDDQYRQSTVTCPNQAQRRPCHRDATVSSHSKCHWTGTIEQMDAHLQQCILRLRRCDDPCCTSMRFRSMNFVEFELHRRLFHASSPSSAYWKVGPSTDVPSRSWLSCPHSHDPRNFSLLWHEPLPNTMLRVLLDNRRLYWFCTARNQLFAQSNTHLVPLKLVSNSDTTTSAQLAGRRWIPVKLAHLFVNAAKLGEHGFVYHWLTLMKGAMVCLCWTPWNAQSLSLVAIEKQTLDRASASFDDVWTHWPVHIRSRALSSAWNCLSRHIVSQPSV